MTFRGWLVYGARAAFSSPTLDGDGLVLCLTGRPHQETGASAIGPFRVLLINFNLDRLFQAPFLSLTHARRRRLAASR